MIYRKNKKKYMNCISVTITKIDFHHEKVRDYNNGVRCTLEISWL